MKSAARRSLLLAISAVLWSTTAAQAYGPLGHEIVGAIADERIGRHAHGCKDRGNPRRI